MSAVRILISFPKFLTYVLSGFNIGLETMFNLDFGYDKFTNGFTRSGHDDLIILQIC